jgi:hypothetical protein
VDVDFTSLSLSLPLPPSLPPYTERQDITLGDILEFLSGASKLPATGFPKNPSVYFCSEDRLPKASTCDVSITFSRGMGLLQYEQFKEKMDLCILGSYGFGSV